MKKIIIILIVLCHLFLKTTSYNNLEIKRDLLKPSSGIIEISKIGLRKVFKKNGNIDYGIVIINPSQFPDIINSMLILAGHSGSGEYAFFNDLYRLKIGDLAIVEYANSKYTYRLVNIYYEKKDGVIKITKIKNTKSLVLITCTNNRKDLQTVYIFKIVN